MVETYAKMILGDDFAVGLWFLFIVAFFARGLIWMMKQFREDNL
jgi:hypothetical protein